MINRVSKRGLALLMVLSMILSVMVISPTKVSAATNLAYGKAVTVSSTENSTDVGSKAVDSNGTTRWSSAFANSQHIIVDLGSTQSVSSVVLKWEAAYASQYQIQTSTDNVNWATVYSNYSGDGGTDTINFSATNVRYLKMYGIQRATAYGFSLWEFEIYGPEPEPITNLAYGKGVTVSSTDNSINTGSKAVDGNGTTRWSSAFANSQHIIVDLGSTQSVSSVVLKWEAAYASQYQIQTSTDNVNWVTVYSNYSGDGGTDTINFSATNVRYLKMYGIQRATAYGFSLWEFEIYGGSSGGGGGAIGVLDYLKGVGRNGTVIGEHNREPNSDPDKYTNAIIGITGKTPALWSGDFLFSQDDVNNRWTMINEAKRQWDNGAIVNIMMHVTNPKQGEVGAWNGGVVSELTDSEWSSLITNGGTLNNAWKARLDTYAQYLQYLEDNNVTVLFRPFHEMNQSIFWWAGRPGSNGTAALYRLTHDYLKNTKGLTNLIWVWDMQDLDLNWSVYNPGNSYWDIFALDVYNGDYFTTAKYNTALNVAGGKPIAIGEAAKLPSPSVLASQPQWAFVMGWSEWVYEPINGIEYNTDTEIRAVYNASNVITLDELPDLK